MNHKLSEEQLRAVLHDISEEAIAVNLSDKALHSATRRRTTLVGVGVFAAVTLALGTVSLAFANTADGRPPATGTTRQVSPPASPVPPPASPVVPPASPVPPADSPVPTTPWAGCQLTVCPASPVVSPSPRR